MILETFWDVKNSGFLGALRCLSSSLCLKFVTDRAVRPQAGPRWGAFRHLRGQARTEKRLIHVSEFIWRYIKKHLKTYKQK